MFSKIQSRVSKLIKTKPGNIIFTVVALTALALALPFMERPK